MKFGESYFCGEVRAEGVSSFFFPVQNTKLLDTLKWQRLSVEEDKGS